MYQLLKLPILIQHFSEHKALDPTISFTDFLSMHYWGEDIDDNDYDRDMKLPFKKFEINHVHFVPSPPQIALVFKSIEWPVVHDYGPDQPQGTYTAAIGSLFRPPRV